MILDYISGRRRSPFIHGHCSSKGLVGRVRHSSYPGATQPRRWISELELYQRRELARLVIK